MTADLLKASGISAGYGDVRVLHEVDIAVKAGEIVCLIGSNGAGKTCSGYRRRRSCAGASRMCQRAGVCSQA